MILDKKLIFSEAQAITATAISTNVIDLGVNGIPYGEAAAIARNIGAGTELPLLIQCVATFNNLTSMVVTLESSDSADLSGSTVHWTSPAILLASLVTGWRPGTRVVPDGTYLRYLGLRYTVTGTAPTTGKMTAAIASEVGTVI